MGTVLTEFDTTPAGWVAAVKAAIDLSSDWSNITGDIMKAVAGNGAQMVVNLNKAAVNTIRQPLAVWRTHDGASGVDERTSYHYWRTVAGATTDPLHVLVSAGPDHLCIATEGPRAGEAGADSATLGSHKSTFFLGAMEPYFAVGVDPIAAVVVVERISDSSSDNTHTVAVSRNAANTTSWVSGFLVTPSILPNTLATAPVTRQGSWTALDGNTYLFPWVVWEIAAGIRGRLKTCFYAGCGAVSAAGDPCLSPGEVVTYDGADYMLLSVGRSTSIARCGQGWVPGVNASSQQGTMPIIAVPK